MHFSSWKAAGVASVRGVFRCISSEAQEDLFAPPPPSSSVQIPLGSRKEEERENFFYPELGPSGVKKRYSKTSCRNAVWYRTLARRMQEHTEEKAMVLGKLGFVLESIAPLC